MVVLLRLTIQESAAPTDEQIADEQIAHRYASRRHFGRESPLSGGGLFLEIVELQLRLRQIEEHFL
jgi:hypothetical protein